MDTLAKLLTPTLRECYDVDITDQLYYFVSAYFLVAFALLVGVRTVTTGALDCWYTNHTGKQDHVNAYCWTHTLYKYPFVDKYGQVPPLSCSQKSGPADLNTINYEELEAINFYRWASVMYLLQALLFTLPRILWITCNKNSGIQIEKLVSMISDKSAETRTFERAAKKIQVWLKFGTDDFKREDCACEVAWDMFCACFCQHVRLILGLTRRICLLKSHIFNKCFYLLMLIVRFIILRYFLGFNYWIYGITFFQIYFATGEAIDNIHFPRLSLCYFEVNGQGGLVQCLLTLNMLLFMLFLIEWFWLLLLFLLTVLSLIVWVCRVWHTYWRWKAWKRQQQIEKRNVRNEPEAETTCCCSPCRIIGRCCRFLCRSIYKCCHPLCTFIDSKTEKWCTCSENKWDLKFMKKYLRQLEIDGFVPQKDKENQLKFILDDLGSAGVFILRMTAANTNDEAMTELIKNLWKLYSEEQTAELMFELHEQQRPESNSQSDVRDMPV